MARFALLLLVASKLEAAAIRGVVLDHYTGRPLARSVVTLEAIQASGVIRTSLRTGSSGQFVFSPLIAGAYLVSAARPNFATLRYGQKFWNAPGVPIVLSDESSPFLDLRLHRLAAIAGTVWDENEIGIAEQEVYAYRPTRPPTLIARARTDDRGAYRIAGLTPGPYLIRTGSKQLDEETGVLPTFYRDSFSVEQARPVEVDLDRQLTDITVRPYFGKLFRLSRKIPPYPEPCAVFSATLISDMGRLR